jgi:DNA polymerase III epsilon subunit-like protein
MRYICFDTETNGFVDRTAKWPNYTLPWENHPVQISIDIVDEDGVVSHAYDAVIAGAKGFAPWVHANVPVTLEQVQTEGLPFTEVLDAFASLIQDGDTIVAHNISFDMMVISKAITRMNIKTPAADKILAAPRFCTMRSLYTKGALGKQPKLSKLCEHFGITLSDAHDARGDTYALAECVSEALRRGVMLCTRDITIATAVPKPPEKVQTTIIQALALSRDTLATSPKKKARTKRAEV